MKCSIIKDLLPLYIDDCCSNESTQLIEEHLKTCKDCKNTYENMKFAFYTEKTIDTPPKKFSRINDWKASIMQSILLFVSFAIIAIGVTLEGHTPSGPDNGIWAISMFIPATGFMLSLANWYFVRIYKTRKDFSLCSCFATFGVILCGYIWALIHYKTLIQNYLFLGIGIAFSIMLCVLSKIASNKYALMIGKDLDNSSITNR